MEVPLGKVETQARLEVDERRELRTVLRSKQQELEQPRLWCLENEMKRRGKIKDC